MKNKNGYTLLEVNVAIMFLLSLLLIPLFALWTDSCLEWWLFYFKHKIINIPFWLSFIITIIGNGFILMFNILTELFKYFL